MGSARVAVVGVTAWGLTLAQQLTRAGATVALLARDEDEAAIVRLQRTHPRRTAAVRLPTDVQIAADPALLRDADLVLFAVPAQAMAANVQRVRALLPAGAPLVSAAKGIEIASGRRMSTVLREESGDRGPVVALSGPNLADEIARGLPAVAVAASTDAHAAALVQTVFASRPFRVYTHDDIVGVELGGALKNIVALAAGINDGLGYGDNAKAALLTRGLAEITRLGVALGAQPLTFAGLSGLGDLIATCASPLSRNRRVGEELGRGRPLGDVLDTLGHVAEGVPTTAAAHALAQQHDVTMPIVEGLHRILFEGCPVLEAAWALMEREPRAESPL